MVRAKTTAQWRREVPAYDKASRAVEHLVTVMPEWDRRVIAHLHPDTRVVSILLRGPGSHTLIVKADGLLADLGYRPGGWVFEPLTGLDVWRKVVAS